MATSSAASDKNVAKMTFPFSVGLANGLVLNSEQQQAIT